MTQSAQFGAPPGCCGAGRPENRVVARSKAPRKKCTGLALPVMPDRNVDSTRSISTSASQNRRIASGSYAACPVSSANGTAFETSTGRASSATRTPISSSAAMVAA